MIQEIVSLGAGVQSSTMVLMAARGEIEPMPTAAIFADTQAEPASVYTWLDWLEKQLPFPVYRVSAGDLQAQELTVRISKKGNPWRDGTIPVFTEGGGLLQRRCTSDFKVAPIHRKIKELCEVKRGSKDVSCIQWIGISVDEVYRVKEAREPFVKNRWPLIEKKMNRQDCFRWMEERGFPKPPRSACVFCPYHSNSEWERLRTQEPEEFQRAVKFESDLQKVVEEGKTGANKPWLHHSMTPLGSIDFAESKQGRLGGFGNECEGMCGV